MATDVGTVLSVDDLLARAKAAAATKSSSSGSKVQQLLAGRDDGDKVDLSPVAKLLNAAKASDAKKAEPFTEQDWYIKAKVAQLKGQIELYSNLPGLDQSGSIMNQLTKEVNELVGKQRAKLKVATDAAAAKQAELAEKDAANAAAPKSVADMLKSAKNAVDGTTTSAPISKEVQALLDKAKGAVVNQTA